MAEDGKKLSKKLQNYSAPSDLANQCGADSIRLYLISSSVIKGEDLNFSDKEVAELQRKVIGRLHNVRLMYEQYADGEDARDDSDNVLDVWIVARTHELAHESTHGFKNYELDRATRPIIDFVDDLSVWYIRRSRDRLKGSDADAAAARATLRYVLHTLARIMAPATPFYAEQLWQVVRGEEEAESVHLTAWPHVGAADADVLSAMVETRRIVSDALELRAKEGIRVRQPLQTLTVQGSDDALSDEHRAVIADEVNVKEVQFDASLSVSVELDTTITGELAREGAIRELMRAVQDLRKKSGYNPEDRIILTIQTEHTDVVTAFEDEIKAKVGADAIEYANTDGETITAGDHNFIVSLITTQSKSEEPRAER